MTKNMLEDIIKHKVNEAWEIYWVTSKLFGKDDPYTKTLRDEWCALDKLARDLNIDPYTKEG